jgi:putative ABC transport system permease protein
MTSYWLIKTWLSRFLNFKIFFAVSLLSVAFAVGLSVCLMNLSLDLSDALLADVKASNGGDISVTWDDNSSWDAVQREISEYETPDQGYTSDFTVMGRARVNQTAAKGSFVVVRGISSKFPLYGNIRVLEPAGVQLIDLFGQPDATLISKTLATRLNLKVGDTLPVGIPGKSWNLRVIGIVADDGHKERDMNIWGYALTDLPAAMGFLHAYESTAQLQVQTDSYQQMQDLSDEFRMNFPNATVKTFEQATKDVRQEIESLNIYFFVVGILAFIICVISVSTMAWFQIARDLKAFAILRNLGMRSFTGWTLFLSQISILALFGGLLGVGIGETLSLFAAPQLATSYNVDIHPVFHLNIALIGLGLAFVFSHVASILPVVAALAVSPTRILRQGQNMGLVVKKRVFVLYVLVICFFISSIMAFVLHNLAGFVIAWALLLLVLALVMIARMFLAIAGRLVTGGSAIANIAVSNIRTFRLRSAATIAGVAISALVIVTLLSSISMLRSYLSQAAASNFNVIAEAPLSKYKEEEARIEEMDGVTGVDEILLTMGKLEGYGGEEESGGQRAPGIQGIFNRERSVPPIIAGENLPEAPRQQDDAIPALISEKTAENRHLSVGDMVQVDTNNQSLTISVTGIYKHLPVNLGDAILIRHDDLPASNWLSSMLMVTVDPVERSGEVAKEINEQLPNSFAYSFEQLTPAVNVVINEKWMPVVGLGILAAAAGMVVCISGIFLSLNQHSLDFGIIKSIGGTKKTLIRLIGYEYALIAVSGTLGGITLGMLLLYVIGRMLLQNVVQPDLLIVVEAFLAVTLLVEAIALVFANLWIRNRPVRLLGGD